jgi:glycosyltransferase involved in cell wall biosynthesis
VRGGGRDGEDVIITKTSVDRRLSVIIPTHNRAHLVCEAIDSVMKLHNYGIDPEIIVVNDGSTDATTHVLAAFGADIILVETMHGERSKARNAGLSRATAPLVAFLDDDDLCVPSGWAELVEKLATRPELSFAYGRALFTDTAGSELAYQPHPERLEPDQLFFSLLAQGCSISMGTIAVRRAPLARTSGFSERMRVWEDWDLWLRLSFAEPGAFVGSTCAVIRNPGWEMPNSHCWPEKLWVRARYSLHEPYFSAMRSTVGLPVLGRFYEQLACDAWSHRQYSISRRAFQRLQSLSPGRLLRPKRMAQYFLSLAASALSPTSREAPA